MNQLQGIDLGFNPGMMGMNMQANNELQKQINENMYNVENKWIYSDRGFLCLIYILYLWTPLFIWILCNY